MNKKENVCNIIKKLYDNGFSYLEIGDIFLCSGDYIRQIHKGYREPSDKFIKIFKSKNKTIDMFIYENIINRITKLYKRLKKIDKHNATDDFISITYNNE